MINFDLNAPNQLLFNPRNSEAELIELKNLQTEFENEFGKNNFILVPSSGSSRGVDESIKLIALKNDRILNSANRVNHYLQATADDNWGLVLPEFHVAGIGVAARAYLMQSKVIKLSGRVQDLAREISENNISFVSLVPTQIYDLITFESRGPKCLKKVFVGGGALIESQKRKIIELGWPIVETYGMTETASMIAVREKEEDLFRPLNNVFVKAEDNRLAVHCDSLLTASVQRRKNKVYIEYFNDGSWYLTQDLVELIRMNSETYMKFLGRSSDYIKILGEGVSLAELRNILIRQAEEIGLSHSAYELIDVENERSGSELVLAYNSDLDRAVIERLIREFNLKCRPYEKIKNCVSVDAIPRSPLGKVMLQELKEKVKNILNSEANLGTIK